MYFNIKTATECTLVYKRRQSVLQYKNGHSVLQYTNGHRVYFNIKTATECTSIFKRPQSVLQYTNGHRVPHSNSPAPGGRRTESPRRAGRSQTNELSAPSLTEQRAKPTRGGCSLTPVSACYRKFRHRALDRYRHRSKNTGVTRQRAEAVSTLSHYKLHPR